MQTFIKSLSTGWNFFRVARLLLGIAALVQAVMLKEWPLALAGLFIAGMALANTGCGIGGCAPAINKNSADHKKINEISYEELDSKK